MEVPAVSVIIPARNAERTLGRTLDCLRGQDLGGALEVVVVDNGSSDGTRALAVRHPVSARVLDGPGTGPGAARNAGAAAASGPVLAFTDADCFPHPGWLREGLAAIAAGRDIVQGRVQPDPGARLRPFDRTVWVSRETGLFETANLFVRREVFDRVGGFADWLDVGPDAGPFGEDVLFGWTARALGATTGFAGAAAVDHAVFPRGPLAYVRERARLRFFPAIAKRIPQTRSDLFYRRCFLSRRSATFDLGAAGVALAAALGSPWPLVATLPYLAMNTRRAWPWRLRAPAVAVVDLAADATALAALAWGSVRRGSVLL